MMLRSISCRESIRVFQQKLFERFCAFTQMEPTLPTKSDVLITTYTVNIKFHINIQADKNFYTKMYKSNSCTKPEENVYYVLRLFLTHYTLNISLHWIQERIYLIYFYTDVEIVSPKISVELKNNSIVIKICFGAKKNIALKECQIEHHKISF